MVFENSILKKSLLASQMHFCIRFGRQDKTLLSLSLTCRLFQVIELIDDVLALLNLVSFEM